MNIKIIACHVFYRELSYIASMSDNVTSVTWLPQGLHNTPDLLQKALQEEIDKAENSQSESSALYHNKAFDAIVLGYGLCSNGVIGLKSNKIPIIIPKTDDCIGVFLGSQKRYLDYIVFHQLNTIQLKNLFIKNKRCLNDWIDLKLYRIMRGLR